ncbi:MAG: dTDP-4-dehydrorhamnose 3,5-epimerase [Elusimicrobia bacterium]|nr:dTDP-4-dehydrorhamnose 3,5-epimerase [Elusimicrobiota bacterium]
MEFIKTELPGVVIVAPDVHRDGRGYFFESYNARKYRAGGILPAFVQDNESSSGRGTLRGLHGQRTKPQGKLVRVISGEVFDVAVDVRRGSPTFGKWFGTVLSGENFRQLYIPPDFLHGFCVLSAQARFAYKVTDFYDSQDEYGVLFNDPELAVAWPVREPRLSERDQKFPLLAEVRGLLPQYRGP